MYSNNTAILVSTLCDQKTNHIHLPKTNNMYPSKSLPFVFAFLFIGTIAFAQKYAYFTQYRDTIREEIRDTSFTMDILFDTDQYGLMPAQIRKLDKLVYEAKQSYQYSIELMGYADFRGSNGYNDTLAARRVDTTQGYLLLRRLKDSLISTKVVGEVPPSVKVTDPDRDLQPDRHVSIKANLSHIVPVPDTIAEIVRVMTCPENDTTIYFENGVEVFILGCSFKDRLLKNLKFESSIVTSRAEMLQSGLTTMTNRGECLQTSGMLVFNVMTRGGTRLSTIDSMPMIVRVPTEEIEEDMALFDAVSNSSSNRGWELSEDSLYTESRDCTDFYVFETTESVNKNLDIPTGFFASNTLDRYFKLRVFKQKNAKPYLSGERSNFKGNFFKKRRYRYPAGLCIPEGERMVTVFVEKKKKSFLFHQPLSNIRIKKDRYLIRKRDFNKLNNKQDMYRLVMNY